MSLENQMTNEEIKNEFHNNFELVNFAIKIAKGHQKGDEEIPSLGNILKETLARSDEIHNV